MCCNVLAWIIWGAVSPFTPPWLHTWQRMRALTLSEPGIFWHPSASTRPWTALCGCVSHGIIIISRHVGAKESFKDTRFVDGQATVYPNKCCSEQEMISPSSYWALKKTCCFNCSQKSKMVICQWLNTIINWELTFDFFSLFFFFFKWMSSFEILSHRHIFFKKLEHNCVFHSVASAFLLRAVQLRAFGDEGSRPKVGLLLPEIMRCVRLLFFHSVLLFFPHK